MPRADGTQKGKYTHTRLMDSVRAVCRELTSSFQYSCLTCAHVDPGSRAVLSSVSDDDTVWAQKGPGIKTSALHHYCVRLELFTRQPMTRRPGRSLDDGNIEYPCVSPLQAPTRHKPDISITPSGASCRTPPYINEVGGGVAHRGEHTDVRPLAAQRKACHRL
jgi:hypothetical protein